MVKILREKKKKTGKDEVIKRKERWRNNNNEKKSIKISGKQKNRLSNDLSYD